MQHQLLSTALRNLWGFRWWCSPTPAEGWERRGTLRRPNSRATPQGLGQRSKMEEVVPKMSKSFLCYFKWNITCNVWTQIGSPWRCESASSGIEMSMSRCESKTPLDQDPFIKHGMLIMISSHFLSDVLTFIEHWRCTHLHLSNNCSVLPELWVRLVLSLTLLNIKKVCELFSLMQNIQLFCATKLAEVSNPEFLNGNIN